MQAQIQTREQQQHVAQIKGSAQNLRDSQTKEEKEDEESSTSALSVFQAKEEEIERKKLEVRERVFTQLGKVEEESKRLAVIRQELEAMADPTRKEVAAIRKKIDSLNHQLKPLGKSCLKKEKEYKQVLEDFNEKNKEKSQLINRLMELVSESERLRMKRLEELSKSIDSLFSKTAEAMKEKS